MMSNADIRRATVADAEALSLLGRAAYLESYFDVMPRADMLAYCAAELSAERFAEHLADPAWRFWAAARPESGNLVGYVALCPPDLPVPTGPRDLEIRRMYVLAPFKGAGLGARMMDTAVEAARAAGAPRLLLGVFSQNHAAQAFYARQGYVPAGESTFWVGESAYADLVMARAL